MNDRIYVYVDGENHFIRSREQWKKAHGDNADLDRIRAKYQQAGALPRAASVLLVDSAGQFFWDPWCLGRVRVSEAFLERATYFTSYVGDGEALYALRVKIRGFGFEPVVVSERRSLAQQRQNLLNTEGVMEKAKGVDIALATRVVEDAYKGLYERCVLFTSDADFMPVIRAVRSIGKKVTVVGFADGLANRSDLLHEPDEFFDFEPYMHEYYLPE